MRNIVESRPMQSDGTTWFWWSKFTGHFKACYTFNGFWKGDGFNRQGGLEAWLKWSQVGMWMQRVPESRFNSRRQKAGSVMVPLEGWRVHQILKTQHDLDTDWHMLKFSTSHFQSRDLFCVKPLAYHKIFWNFQTNENWHYYPFYFPPPLLG